MPNPRKRRRNRDRAEKLTTGSDPRPPKIDLEGTAAAPPGQSSSSHPRGEQAVGPAFQPVRGQAGKPVPHTGPQVVVALASTGKIHEQTLTSMQTMIRATRRAASVEMWWRNASPASVCRNRLVQRFLADPTKTHLVFLDTDMVVPESGLDTLLETNEPLVCGPAPICRREQDDPAPVRTQPDLTTNIMDAADPTLWNSPVDPEDATVNYSPRRPDELPDTLFTCDVTGMSFCLIAREVLERMTPPWFQCVDVPGRSTVGEDVYFFRKARQLGYRVAVHPGAWCDHIKRVNLTRLEELMGGRLPESQWNRTQSAQTPRTLVVACTTQHWLDFRTAEVLIRWQEEPGDRIGVRLFEASDVGFALTRWLHHPAPDDQRWERILLLGPNVIPSVDLVHQLGSIDAPVVSTLGRALIDGQVAYTFGQRDSVTGRIDYPVQLSPTELTQPFPAHTVDLACSMIRRDACRHATEAFRFAVDQPDPVRALDLRFCDLVREHTGCDPVVAPVFVERSADVGLMGLLQIKQRAHAQQQTQPQPAQPAGV